MQDQTADPDELIAARHQTAVPSGNGRLLTILEAATMLGISRSSIYRLFGSGQLCWVRVCGSRRVTAAEINRFIGAPTEAAS